MQRSQAINKEVKGKKPKGSEYRQAKLAARNIDLVSAQGIEISGSDITASQKLNIEAAGVLPQTEGSDLSAILIDGTTDQYEIGNPVYFVLNMDGSRNEAKTLAGRGRKLNLK